MNKAATRELLCRLDFKGLFLNELGWDDHDGALPMEVGDATVTLTAIAEKCAAWPPICVPCPAQASPTTTRSAATSRSRLAKSEPTSLVVVRGFGQESLLLLTNVALTPMVRTGPTNIRRCEVIEIRLLSENPERPLSGSRASDAAFDTLSSAHLARISNVPLPVSPEVIETAKPSHATAVAAQLLARL